MPNMQRRGRRMRHDARHRTDLGALFYGSWGIYNSSVLARTRARRIAEKRKGKFPGAHDREISVGPGTNRRHSLIPGFVEPKIYGVTVSSFLRESYGGEAHSRAVFFERPHQPKRKNSNQTEVSTSRPLEAAEASQ